MTKYPVTRLPPSVPERTINDLLLDRAERFAEQVGLIGESGYGGEVRLTYRELLDRVRRLATVLREQGVGRGDRVGILTTNAAIIESIVCYHAAHFLGAIAVPFNARYVARELSWVLAKTRPRVVLVSPDLLGLIAECYEEADSVEPALLVTAVAPAAGDDVRRLISEAAPRDPVEVAEEDDADWVFTSGTTGHPKAVAITHAASVACGYQSSRLWGLHERSVYSSSAPFFTSTGFHTNQLATLAAGCAYLCEAEFDVYRTLANIERHRVTSVFIITGMLQLIMERVGEDGLRDVDLSSLERICYGAQPTSGTFAQSLERVFARARGIELVHLYGLTEGGTSGTLVRPDLHADAIARALESSYGMPVGSEGFNEWIEVTVRDEDGNVVADGVVGELCLRGPALMDRYVDEPEATARSLRDGLLYTGDFGVQEDGYLFYVDRAGQMIRRGGLNISSVEIETVLSDCPGVREAAAVAVSNPILGEEVAAVVVAIDESLDDIAVIDFCRTRLADYKVPVRVEFVDQLPRNGMGRVQKHRLLSR